MNTRKNIEKCAKKNKIPNQSKAKQSKAKQSKAKQSKTKKIKFKKIEIFFSYVNEVTFVSYLLSLI
jgi:hypothetical protein